MSNQPIGQEVFVKLLSLRFKGKYSVAQISSVLQHYTSSKNGILSFLNKHQEFRESYFGAWRMTEKGWNNYQKKVDNLLDGRIEISYLSHKFQRRKKICEKRNRFIWKIDNAVNGFKYQNKPKQEFLKAKGRIRARQIKFTNKRLKRKLKFGC